MSTPPLPPDPNPIPCGAAVLQRDPRTLLSADSFNSVTKTVLDGNPGMATELAERITSEGLKFVVAGAAHPNLALAPSRVVDEGWHALLVHTRVYGDLCRRHGRFVHHSPGYDPTFYDPLILIRTQNAIRDCGFSIDRDLWAGPLNGTISVAAQCQHAPECAIQPMPTPGKPGLG